MIPGASQSFKGIEGSPAGVAQSSVNYVETKTQRGPRIIDFLVAPRHQFCASQLPLQHASISSVPVKRVRWNVVLVLLYVFRCFACKGEMELLDSVEQVFL